MPIKLRDPREFVAVVFYPINPNLTIEKLTETKQWIESVFSAVDIQQGITGRLYSYVPISKFVEMYPDSHVAKTGITKFENFPIPIALTGLINDIMTEACPVHA